MTPAHLIRDNKVSPELCVWWTRSHPKAQLRLHPHGHSLTHSWASALTASEVAVAACPRLSLPHLIQVDPGALLKSISCTHYYTQRKARSRSGCLGREPSLCSLTLLTTCVYPLIGQWLHFGLKRRSFGLGYFGIQACSMTLFSKQTLMILKLIFIV